jgi:hypothetical protein
MPGSPERSARVPRPGREIGPRNAVNRPVCLGLTVTPWATAVNRRTETGSPRPRALALAFVVARDVGGAGPRQSGSGVGPLEVTSARRCTMPCRSCSVFAYIRSAATHSGSLLAKGLHTGTSRCCARLTLARIVQFALRAWNARSTTRSRIFQAAPNRSGRSPAPSCSSDSPPPSIEPHVKPTSPSGDVCRSTQPYCGSISGVARSSASRSKAVSSSRRARSGMRHGLVDFPTFTPCAALPARRWPTATWSGWLYAGPVPVPAPVSRDRLSRTQAATSGQAGRSSWPGSCTNNISTRVSHLSWRCHTVVTLDLADRRIRQSSRSEAHNGGVGGAQTHDLTAPLCVK